MLRHAVETALKRISISTIVSMLIFIIINNTDIVHVIIITGASIYKAENFYDIISCNFANLPQIFHLADKLECPLGINLKAKTFISKIEAAQNVQKKNFIAASIQPYNGS